LQKHDKNIYPDQKKRLNTESSTLLFVVKAIYKHLVPLRSSLQGIYTWQLPAAVVILLQDSQVIPGKNNKPCTKTQLHKIRNGGLGLIWTAHNKTTIHAISQLH